MCIDLKQRKYSDVRDRYKDMTISLKINSHQIIFFAGMITYFPYFVTYIQIF